VRPAGRSVMQMSRSIELVRYQDFEGELLALELVTAAKTDLGSGGVGSGAEGRRSLRSDAGGNGVEQRAQAAPKERDRDDDDDGDESDHQPILDGGGGVTANQGRLAQATPERQRSLGVSPLAGPPVSWASDPHL
jgi:hypothetical protein